MTVAKSILHYSSNNIKTRSRNAIDVFRDRKLDLIIEKGDVLNFNKRTGKLKIYVMISNGNWHTNFVKSMISFSLKH